jgi:hypothetical protein
MAANQQVGQYCNRCVPFAEKLEFSHWVDGKLGDFFRKIHHREVA